MGMKKQVKLFKRVAAARNAELWWDCHLKLWALMELSTHSVAGHYITSSRLRDMTLAEMRAECESLHRDVSVYGIYQKPKSGPMAEAVQP